LKELLAFFLVEIGDNKHHIKDIKWTDSQVDDLKNTTNLSEFLVDFAREINASDNHDLCVV